MRKEFVIFFSIVFSFYSLINYYIFLRAYQALILPDILPVWLFTAIIILLYPSFFLGRYLFKKTSAIKRKSIKRVMVSVSRTVSYIGSLWFGGIAYFLITLLTLDAARIVYFAIKHPFPFEYSDSFIVISIGIILLIAGGHINTRIIRVKKITLPLPSGTGITKEIRFTALSDIHLGSIMTPPRLKNIITAINKTNPDFVLIAGDVFDEDISLVIEEKSGDLFKTIKAPGGVYTVMGNHEYFGGVDRAVEYLRTSGVRVLRDEAIYHPSGVVIAGRDDLTYNRFSGKKRKTIQELFTEVENRSSPVILLDHQPTKLNVTAEANIFLQISGHTHHGQLFPFNFITKRVYEVSYGYKLKDNTHLYVSCGSGTWGPPMRIGNRPEVVAFTLVPHQD